MNIRGSFCDIKLNELISPQIKDGKPDPLARMSMEVPFQEQVR